MNPKDLERRLLAAGCNPSSFHIGTRGMVSDAWLLYREAGEWRVAYTERGQIDEPVFRSTDADEAAEQFFEQVTSFDHWHCVGFFEAESEAEALCYRLRSLGIEPIRNDIPAFHGPGDPRYRVFVIGQDIFTVRAALGELPADDSAPRPPRRRWPGRGR